MALFFQVGKLADDISDTFTLAKICLQNLKIKLAKSKQLFSTSISRSIVGAKMKNRISLLLKRRELGPIYYVSHRTAILIDRETTAVYISYEASVWHN